MLLYVFLSHIYIIYDKQYHMSSESNCPEYNECEFKQLLSKQVNIVLYCKNNLVCFCSVLLTKILPTAPQQNCFASPSNTAVFSEWIHVLNKSSEWMTHKDIYLHQPAVLVYYLEYSFIFKKGKN